MSVTGASGAAAPAPGPTLRAEVIAAALGQFPPTAEQAAVIESPLSPALVVAGAGSGKTETMAGRVVWLVANAVVRRDEVLGLTFTRKAAGELAERIQRRLLRLGEFESRGLLPHLPALHADGLLDVFGEIERSGLAGPAAARARAEAIDALATRTGAVATESDDDPLLHRPTVATYNSFADQIVREHAVRIGRDAEAAVLSESAAWLMMRRVVFASDDQRLETRGEAVRSIVDAALRIARDGVDNMVSFDDLAAFPERFADVLARPSTNARTVVYADVAEAETRVSALALLADLAVEYGAAKRRAGVIDFSDQVAGAVEIMRGHPQVSAELRDRYRVVLLDEYQDTSVVQTDLLSGLFAGTAVMAVGDPHQAIYGWRGASAGNLGGFAAAFAPGGECARFSLMTSWRNSASVLAAANAVLAPLAASSPVDVGELRPRPGAPDGAVDVAFDADIDAEADRVAGWFAGVRAHRTAQGSATTGAILFRSKKHMVRFGDALGRRGIPHRILGLGGLLSTPEVVDVVSALRVVSDPTAGSAVIRLLAGPRWAVGLPDLRELAALSRRLVRHDAALQPLAPDVLDAIRASAGGDEGSLVDALDFIARARPDHGWLAGFTDAARERLREAGAVFAGLRQAAGMPIPELVRLIELELRLDIELAANESRGPSRIASAQLRAFVDELHAFLAADETGSISSLLAWLDHAEQLDEFAPRTEPPEDDVVQLLTIHGSKGLEWDAVAVVRLVKDELPSMARDTKAWLGFGILPYEFRGDAAWLPALRWRRDASPTQQDLKGAIEEFVAANRARQLDEDRRLAYVAVTRARDHLLLTGASWSGTRRPRERSVFYTEMADALGIDVPVDDPGEDPYLGERRMLSWPIDPLGERRSAVEAAAAAVDAARSAALPEPDRDVALLLAERRQELAPPVAPTRIAASRYKDFVADYAGTVNALARPLPERPFRQTRLGTLFHAWVEERSGGAGIGGSLDDALWEIDDEGATEASAADESALAALRETFLRSEWAQLRPLEVETEIDFTITGLDDRPHVVICKLDAVYRRDDRGGRIEIVDWKTGAAPRTAAERTERMLQLELYRQAYHARHGVPLDEIDVALYYVAHDLVLRG
ncbi:ATP-dependent DNA helicase [Microbacterium terrae]|uniref:DNA 3'-5' helicase n=1 Tax=Microbacterium terrae TaxID=69369 RepID=A0A0M2HG64_9MICO|nr:ATP-dependent DNA helicase [Microbacterium terrae]KJL43721.1 DNA helicase II [Microbacterium terrae]KJL43744.1 DNA helicase II [Microbacterium terrae]GLJ99585.1 ATP-dependent DNA helicase [Microbacterium terrae]